MFHDANADVLFLAGRILYGGTLVFMAGNHFMRTKDLAGFAAMRGVPKPTLAVLVSGGLLFLGGLSVLLGYRPDVGALLVTAFFVPVTLLMHNFWKDTDPMMKMQNMSHFFKGWVMLGGAWLAAAVPEPWAFALGP